MSRQWGQHPARHVCKGAVHLLYHENFGASETLSPNNNHRLATAGMKRIENAMFSVLIPGSMSLP
jgi:hypothetical protein